MSVDYLLKHFYGWILSYPHSLVLWVIISIIFVASVLESLPLLGMMFPSESLTIFFGILAYKGIVDIWILIIATYIGILAGDIAGYLLGKRVGEDFLRKHAKRLKINSKKYEKVKSMLDQNLIKALFIGRTNGFTRWIAPFLSGANGISLKKFIFANMLTAAFWAPAFLLGGYFLGNAFEVYGKYFGLGIIVATIIAIAGYKMYNHFKEKGWLEREDFKLFIINIFGLYLVSKMIEDILDLELVTKLDMWISSHISEIYTPLFTTIMKITTAIDNPFEISIIISIFAIYLIYKKWYMDLLLFLSSLFGSSAVMFILKDIIQRPRPTPRLIEVTGYSFPSGHATVSTTLGLSLYLILKDKVKHKKILLTLCIIYPVVISFSRVYLNVHYFSDVVGGIGVGLFVTSLMAMVVEMQRNKRETGETKL